MQQADIAIITTITDYDTWNSMPVVFDEIKKVMAQNLDNTKRILEEVVPRLPQERDCICKDALKGAGEKYKNLNNLLTSLEVDYPSQLCCW